MKSDALRVTAELFYDSYHIPVCCCDEEMQPQKTFPGEWHIRSFEEAADYFRATEASVSLYSDSQFLHWGCIRDAEGTEELLIGPISSVPLEDQAVRAFMRAHTIPGNAFEEMKSCFDRIPVMTFQQFLHILRFLHFQINGERIDEDVLLNTYLPDSEQPNRYSQSRFYANRKTTGEPIRSFEESYRIEQMILHLIDTGNVKELQNLAMNAGHAMPDIGSTPMSQQKMTSVIIVTVISRHVIRMGMDVNTAMRLSDLYIRGIESARNTKELTALVNNAYADYSERLRALRIPTASSPLIHKCAQYVQQMINTPTSVSDVAQYVGKSASYVSARFKSEMGCTLSSFITLCKIEEAKSLLLHTDMTIADISSYLCFSDQCYFHRAFRKVTGMTPLKYRKES